MKKLSLIIFLFLIACSAQQEVIRSTPSYKISRKQVAPEPVYNPIRWVHLPDPLPSKKTPKIDSPELEQVFQLDLKNSTIEESSYALASALHYRSYCASTIANEKLTISTIGTITEISDKIEKLAGIKIVLDHDNREVRFLSGAVK